MPALPNRTRSALSTRLRRPLARFLRVEAAGGIVLLLATFLALAWENSPWGASYELFWQSPLKWQIGDQVWQTTLRLIVNDALMSIFFLVVGLEIRRELHDGELSSRGRAILPVMAAAGGILTPGLVYLAIAGSAELRRGWAIPTATDIAFAVGVLTMLGRRVPAAVRVLLLALAIVDDVVAVLVIAVFYSGGILISGLLVAVAGLGLVLLLQRCAVRSPLSYLLPGAVLWIGLLHSGVHPALTGVILGLLTPPTGPLPSRRLLRILQAILQRLGGRPAPGPQAAHPLAHPLGRARRGPPDGLLPLERLQQGLHPWVAFVVMPVFALANAGIRFRFEGADESTVTLTWAIITAMVIGKPVGISLFTWAALLGQRERSARLSWRGVVLTGCLGGIGFTMSIFLTNVAFQDPKLIASGRSAVLLGSAAAALVSLLLGRLILRPPPTTSHRPSPD